MKRIAFFFIPILTFVILFGCNGSSSGGGASDSTAMKADSGSVKTDSLSGSSAGFKLGVQMWTFKEFSFSDALDKVDSAGIKNIEAFTDHRLGGGMTGSFGPI